MTDGTEAPVLSVGRGPGADEAARLLEGNREFVESRTREDPDAFRRLGRGQEPPFFLLGCCDSRKPLDLLTRTAPGELFILRNVANLLTPGDDAAEAALEFAMTTLAARHLVIVGHTRCGGVEAGLKGMDEGALGRWIAPVRRLAEDHRRELEEVEDHEARVDRLAKLNVIAQVGNALRHPAVRARLDGDGPPLHVHGWMFRIETGRLKAVPLPVDEWREEGLVPEP